MKEIKVNAPVALAAVALGSVGGGIVGYVLARSRARREYAARLDAEVEALKAHYTRPLVPKVVRDAGVVTIQSKRPRWTDVIKETLNEEPVRDDSDGRLEGPLAADSADTHHDRSIEGKGAEGSGRLPDVGVRDSLVTEEDELEPQQDPLEGCEPDGPFPINEEAFGELKDEGFQQISVTYYAADKTLCDDKDVPIRDILGTVGTLNPRGFGGISNDPHIRYVRNRRLEVDFEILLDARAYADVVLGYGQPNSRREANTGATTAAKD